VWRIFAIVLVVLSGDELCLETLDFGCEQLDRASGRAQVGRLRLPAQPLNVCLRRLLGGSSSAATVRPRRQQRRRS
jgi:hypothetical protein